MKNGKRTKRHSAFGNLVFAFALLAAAGLLLCSFAKFIPPSLAYFPALPGFAFPVLLVLNILLALAYLLLRQRRCLIFLACILANYSNIQSFIRLKGNPEPERSQWEEDGRIKVLSYNVHLFDYYSSREENRGMLKDQLLSFLEDQDADIVCLQEYYESKNSSFASSGRMKAFGYRYATSPAEKPSFYYGNRIYSKYPIIGEGSLKGLTPFDLVYADILIGGDTLRVYDMHLSSFRFDETDSRFLSSLTSLSNSETYKHGTLRMLRKMKKATLERQQQVRRILEHACGENTPSRILICGDMNDHPVSNAYMDFKRNDFKDSFVKAGKGTGQSYQGFYPSYRIDYLFYKGRVDVLYFDTHKVEYSDHRPVSAVFDLHPPREKASPES